MSVALVPDAPTTGPSGRRYARMGTPSQLVIQRVMATPPANATAAALTPRFSRARAAGGAVVGASVPVSVFVVSHTTALEPSFASIALWGAVLGGLVFSAGTVYRYCCEAFGGARGKAAAYCALSETIMTFAPGQLILLSVAMLAILVAINAIATGRTMGGAR